MGFGFNGIPSAEVTISGDIELDSTSLGVYSNNKTATADFLSVPAGKIYKIYAYDLMASSDHTSTATAFFEIGGIRFAGATFQKDVSTTSVWNSSLNLYPNYIVASAGEAISVTLNNAYAHATFYFVSEDI